MSDPGQRHESACSGDGGRRDAKCTPPCVSFQVRNDPKGGPPLIDFHIRSGEEQRRQEKRQEPEICRHCGSSGCLTWVLGALTLLAGALAALL